MLALRSPTEMSAISYSVSFVLFCLPSSRPLILSGTHSSSAAVTVPLLSAATATSVVCVAPTA